LGKQNITLSIPVVKNILAWSMEV